MQSLLSVVVIAVSFVLSPTLHAQPYPPKPIRIAESLPGYDSRGWLRYLAPAGTPAEITHGKLIRTIAFGPQ